MLLIVRKIIERLLESIIFILVMIDLTLMSLSNIVSRIFFNFLHEHAISMDRHIIWSDNCTGQFKNARMFYRLCRMHVERGVPHIWNFFESDHGKGEHDGAGACVKRALVKEDQK